MTPEQKTKIEKLHSQFKALHKELLSKKEYLLASKLSEVYHEAQTVNYIAGMYYMKNLYEL
mgnify:CR=1 FL=1